MEVGAEPHHHSAIWGDWPPTNTTEDLGDPDWLEAEVSLQETRHDIRVLGWQDRTRGIDEAGSRGELRDETIGDRSLDLREALEVFLFESSARLWVAPKYAEPAARCVHEDAIGSSEMFEHPIGQRPFGFDANGLDVGRPGTARAFPERGKLVFVDVEGNDPASTSEERSERQRLAARARTSVDHQTARRRRHQLGDELAAFVLHLESSVVECGGLKEVSTLRDSEPIRRVARGLELEALRFESNLERFPRAL
jgi:hypothetical protein